MGTSLLAGSTMLGMSGLLGLFSDWAIRATLILMVVFGIAALLRRAAAASRHVVWAVGLVSVLVVPIVAVALPWRLNVLPALGRSEAPQSAITTPALPQPVDRASVSTTLILPSEVSEADILETTPPPEETLAKSPTTVSGVSRRLQPTLLQVVIAMWAAVAAAVSLRVLLGLLLAWRLTSRARPLNDPSWSLPLGWAAERLGRGATGHHASRVCSFVERGTPPCRAVA
jgi:hypothetical protein